MTVELASDGTWSLVDPSGCVIKRGLTNEEAWRHFDRLNVGPPPLRRTAAAWRSLPRSPASGEGGKRINFARQKRAEAKRETPESTTGKPFNDDVPF